MRFNKLRVLSSVLFQILSHNMSSFHCSKHKISGYSFKESKIFLLNLPNPVIVLEADEMTQSKLVDKALEASDAVNSDPYGSVLWPAAYTVANRILEYENLKASSVLELGAGTGLVSLTCALAGSKNVIASDYHPLTLELIKVASKLQYKDVNIETQLFDIKGKDPLPPADILVVADLLYEPALGRAVAHRAFEAYSRGTRVIIGDSPNRPGRIHMLNTLEELGIKFNFKDIEGKTVTGYRHELISNSNTNEPKPVNIGLLEF